MHDPWSPIDRSIGCRSSQIRTWPAWRIGSNATDPTQDSPRQISSGFGTAVGGRQVIELSTLATAEGFVIQGDAAGDNAGHSVGCGRHGFADLIGGAGDDTITVGDFTFALADGGSGTDLLVLTGAGATFDFTTFADVKTPGIEAIDFDGSRANTLTLGLKHSG